MSSALREGGVKPLPFAARALRRVSRWLAPVWLPGSDTIAFLHVPKTAGTAYSASLRAALRPLRVVDGFDRSTFGGFTDFASMARRQRQQIYRQPWQVPRHAAFITGHFAASTLREAAPRGRIVMLLREPESRILSQWAYWRARPAEELEALGRWAERIRLARAPLDQFLAHPLAACQVDNVYVRALLWPHPLIPPDGFIDPVDDAALLRAARAVLAGFSFTAVVEWAGLPGALAGWAGAALDVPVVNVTDRMPAALRAPLAPQLAGAAAPLLAARARLDRALWQDIAERDLGDGADALADSTRAATRRRYTDLMGG